MVRFMKNLKIPDSMKKQAILLSTHFFNDYIFSGYNKLQEAMKDDMDLFLLIERDDNSSLIPENIHYFPFTLEMLNNLNYEPIAETLIPGSNHFQVFQFYKTHPCYDFFWNIEYDVFLNGDWSTLFEKFEFVDSDFISSHLERYPKATDWMWWDSLQLKNNGYS